MASDRFETDRLVPDSALLTVLGLLAGLFVGGPVPAALFGAFGLVVGTRLDELRAREADRSRLEGDRGDRSDADG